MTTSASGGSTSGSVHEKTIALHPGAFPYIKNARLAEPSIFYSEMDGSNTCYPLIIDGQEIDWIYGAIKTKTLLLFFKCEKNQEDISKLYGAPKNAIPGWVRPESYTLKRAGSKWKLKKLNIPNYSAIASDKHCDSFIAYWAFKDAVLFAYVYDMRTKQLIFKQEIESSRGKDFSTDAPGGAFGEPKWNSSCTSVEFPTNYFVKTPIKAEIKR
ncbi:MAG: hypothetical protein MUO64_04005 [Anaerolineales bacterium]|nr:hypothetical protein [Anaerolineales bacterium]